MWGSSVQLPYCVASGSQTVDKKMVWTLATLRQLRDQ